MPGREGATSWTMHKRQGPSANTIHGIGGIGRVQERLTPRARRASHCGGGKGSGARTDISSVIELCAFDWSIFFCGCFCRDFFKNKEIER